MVFKVFDPTTGERVLPIFVSSGVPDSSTFAGVARKGALLLDELNGNIYKNFGSQNAPNWTDISTILGEDVSVGTITGTSDIEALSSVTGAVTTAGGMGVAKNLFVGGKFSALDRATGLAAVGTDRDTALVLTKQFNNVATVAASTAGVLLPSAAGGIPIFLWNNGANPMHVYAMGAEIIDGVSGVTGVTLTNAKSAIFYPISSTAFVSMTGTSAT